MSHIALCADFHFGYANRLNDLTWAARVLNAYCADHNIDTIINLGDLTHDRKSIDIDVYCAIYDILTEATKAGIQWYTILGNHDCYLKHSWTINSAKPLSSLITVIDNVKLLIIDDRRFWCLPFIHFENSYMRILKNIDARTEEGDNLFTHIGVRGSTLNTVFMIKDWSFVHFENTTFNRVYAGHFHTHQQVGTNVWYPGSIIPFKHDEEGQHGFLDYDTESNTHTFIDIWQAGAIYYPDHTPPQYMTILDIQIPMLVPEDVNGNIVRIAPSRPYTHDEKIQLKSTLAELGATKITWLQNSSPNIIPSFNNGTKLTSPGELFVRWVHQDKPTTLNPKLLIKLETEIRATGDERYTCIELDT